MLCKGRGYALSIDLMKCLGKHTENEHLLACVLGHIHIIMCVFNSYLAYYTTEPLAWCLFSIGNTPLVYGEPLVHLEYALVFITSLS